jgi:membrane-associated protease RseP (regulator of RpoE activity)
MIMSVFKVCGIGLAVVLGALSHARAQQPGNSSAGDFFVQRETNASVAPPRMEWIFLANDVDNSSGLNIAALDDAARAHLKLPKGEGLLVVSLAPQCPAAQAGVCQNDILLALEDAPLSKPEDLEVQLKAAGDKPLTLGLLHQGQKKTLKVLPQVRVTFGPIQQTSSTFWIGVQVAALEPALRSHLAVPEDRGLLATEVVADSPAAKAGLRANDILLTMAGTPLRDQSVLIEAVQRIAEKPAAIEIIREGARQTIEVTPLKRSVAAVTARAATLHHAIANYNLFRPGVVFEPEPQRATFTYNQAHQPNPVITEFHASGNPTDKKLEAMDAELKDLRKAVEELTKAIKDRK